MRSVSSVAHVGTLVKWYTMKSDDGKFRSYLTQSPNLGMLQINPSQVLEATLTLLTSDKTDKTNHSRPLRDFLVTSLATSLHLFSAPPSALPASHRVEHSWARTVTNQTSRLRTCCERSAVSDTSPTLRSAVDWFSHWTRWLVKHELATSVSCPTRAEFKGAVLTANN